MNIPHELSAGNNSKAMSGVEDELADNGASGDISQCKEKEVPDKIDVFDDVSDPSTGKVVDNLQKTDVRNLPDSSKPVSVADANFLPKAAALSTCIDNKDYSKSLLSIDRDITADCKVVNSNMNSSIGTTFETFQLESNTQFLYDGESKSKTGNNKSENKANSGCSLVEINNETNIEETKVIPVNKQLDKTSEKALECDAILNPLMLEKGSATASGTDGLKDFNKKLTFSPMHHRMLDNETPCMLCDHIESNMDSPSHYNEYLCHLIVEHQLVIADVKLIADLQSYAVYWKKRFDEESVESFCSKIITNTGAKDVDKSEEYFLLCDALPEDKRVREQLQFDKLKKLLLRQEFERKDESFSRTCPFCKKLFQGNRIILFDHMNVDHSFNIGHPDNIVNVRELLDEIQTKLDNCQCLFCENYFRDRVTLREHMRKKGHRRINPENKGYDKFYMINYLELGKNWQIMQSESERLDGNSDDWSGWSEECQKAYCFFCSESFEVADKVYKHMKEKHDFDFLFLRQEMQLSFYQQIKLINYIRRQVHMAKLAGCSDVVDKIQSDLKSNTKWNQPQYYFSTYEDDTILCQLEDKEGVFEPEDSFVIGEDGIDCRTIISDSVLTDLVVRGFFDS